MTATAAPRNDWSLDDISALFALPFNDLLLHAQQVHRAHFTPNAVQISTLLSIKTGACPEDCKYCPQSGHYNTQLEKEKLMAVDEVVEQARAAKEAGASRFCMGAAWKSPQEKDLRVIEEMVHQVKALGLETCMTLGTLNNAQADRLAAAGLDYYNHNLDTSPEYYSQVTSTRKYEVGGVGEHVACCGLRSAGCSTYDLEYPY